LAGPNLYQLHSFRELRAVMGRVYVVCESCRRYVGVGGWLDNLDSRIVSFSCSVCGRPGKLTFDDPVKDGLQHDMRANPTRHPEVAARLQHMRHRANPFGRRLTVVHELLPTSNPQFEAPLPAL
jgi:hypothetical protein